MKETQIRSDLSPENCKKFEQYKICISDQFLNKIQDLVSRWSSRIELDSRSSFYCSYNKILSMKHMIAKLTEKLYCTSFLQLHDLILHLISTSLDAGFFDNLDIVDDALAVLVTMASSNIIEGPQVADEPGETENKNNISTAKTVIRSSSVLFLGDYHMLRDLITQFPDEVVSESYAAYLSKFIFHAANLMQRLGHFKIIRSSTKKTDFSPKSSSSNLRLSIREDLFLNAMILTYSHRSFLVRKAACDAIFRSKLAAQIHKNLKEWVIIKRPLFSTGAAQTKTGHSYAVTHPRLTIPRKSGNCFNYDVPTLFQEKDPYDNPDFWHRVLCFDYAKETFSRGALILALEDEHYLVRCGALKVLTTLYHKFLPNDTCIQVIFDMFADDNDLVRLEAAKALDKACEYNLALTDSQVESLSQIFDFGPDNQMLGGLLNLGFDNETGFEFRKSIRSVIEKVGVPNPTLAKSLCLSLLKNLRSFPNEKQEIWKAFIGIGKRNSDHVIALFEEEMESVLDWFGVKSLFDDFHISFHCLIHGAKTESKFLINILSNEILHHHQFLLLSLSEIFNGSAEDKILPNKDLNSSDEKLVSAGNGEIQTSQLSSKSIMQFNVLFDMCNFVDSTLRKLLEQASVAELWSSNLIKDLFSAAFKIKALSYFPHDSNFSKWARLIWAISLIIVLHYKNACSGRLLQGEKSLTRLSFDFISAQCDIKLNEEGIGSSYDAIEMIKRHFLVFSPTEKTIHKFVSKLFSMKLSICIPNVSLELTTGRSQDFLNELSTSAMSIEVTKFVENAAEVDGKSFSRPIDFYSGLDLTISGKIETIGGENVDLIPNDSNFGLNYDRNNDEAIKYPNNFESTPVEMVLVLAVFPVEEDKVNFKVPLKTHSSILERFNSSEHNFKVDLSTDFGQELGQRQIFTVYSCICLRLEMDSLDVGRWIEQPDFELLKSKESNIIFLDKNKLHITLSSADPLYLRNLSELFD